MKISYSIIITLFISLSLFSCKEEEPEQFDNIPGALVASIEGVTYDFSDHPRATIGTANDIPAVFISGTALSDYIRELNLTIVNLDGPGTYLIDGISLNSGYYQYYPAEGGAGTSYGTGPSAKGEIIVSSYHDNKITGTFRFDAVKNGEPETIIEISGSFDLNVSE